MISCCRLCSDERLVTAGQAGEVHVHWRLTATLNADTGIAWTLC